MPDCVDRYLAALADPVIATLGLSIPEAEKAMLAMPQGDAPVVHLFSPGLCVRQVTLPTGSVAIGHLQKYEHLNVLLEGSVTMDDGTTLTAPLIFVGKPGRKRGYVHSKVTWLNIYPTDLTSGDEVETHFIDKSSTFQEHQAEDLKVQGEDHAEDRVDFLRMMEDIGVTFEQVKAETENPDDQIKMPPGVCLFQLGDSPIQGKGIFATSPIFPGQIIGLANIDGKRTPLGRYTNHSAKPNAIMVYEFGRINLYATDYIEGQKGGMLGKEITIDYRKARKEAQKCLL